MESNLQNFQGFKGNVAVLDSYILCTYYIFTNASPSTAYKYIYIWCIHIIKCYLLNKKYHMCKLIQHILQHNIAQKISSTINLNKTLPEPMKHALSEPIKSGRLISPIIRNQLRYFYCLICIYTYTHRSISTALLFKSYLGYSYDHAYYYFIFMELMLNQ